MNYSLLINKLAKKHKRKPIKSFHDRDIEYTYEHIRRSSLRIANFLMQKKVSKGDRVAVWCGNVPESEIFIKISR